MIVNGKTHTSFYFELKKIDLKRISTSKEVN